MSVAGCFTVEPSRPLLIYDGDCGFCRMWVRRWQSACGDRVDFEPYRQVSSRYPEIPVENFRRAVHLAEPEGRISSAAEAVFRMLDISGVSRWPLLAYRTIPPLRWASEWTYRRVANHRALMGRVTDLFWGDLSARPTYFATRRLILLGIALVYLIAFLSLAVQIRGLVGEQGIIPACSWLERVRERVDDPYFRVPTLFWLDCNDALLAGSCWVGAGLAALLMIGVAPVPTLVALWALYLSLTRIGGAFLHFQWDALLLEAGLLSIFVAPWGLLPFRRDAIRPPSRLMILLLRLLLFKLMFLSGVVKLNSGDPTWRDLTALDYHYWSQPLPMWTSWHIHHFPSWFHKASLVIMFAVELVLPFLMFLPRRLRHLAGLGTILLMVCIGLTGNYTYFNLLTIVLCVPLFDDAFWTTRRFAPRAILSWAGRRATTIRFPGIRLGFFAIVAVAIGTLNISATLTGARWVDAPPAWIERAQAAVRPFGAVNQYGLFRVMTTRRDEIILQGSDDGVTWKDYEFRWKPGDVNRAPGIVQPHQPRLDWQMWFAALGRMEQNPWFSTFMRRVQEGSPHVVDLLEINPFPDRPPRYLRAMLYRYSFTSPGERVETGAWWKRELVRTYAPAQYRN